MQSNRADQWQDTAFDAVSLSRLANDNCEHLIAEVAALRVRERELTEALQAIEAMDDGWWGEGAATPIRKAQEAFSLARRRLFG
jgi:hypothetical protein